MQARLLQLSTSLLHGPSKAGFAHIWATCLPPLIRPLHGLTQGRAPEGGDHECSKLMVIQPRIQPKLSLLAKLREALRLAEALGAPPKSGANRQPTPSYLIVQCPRSGGNHKYAGPRVNAATYFGSGTVSTVGAHLAALRSDLDAVFVNTVLSGIQQRNLEAAWGFPVLDRVGLIIEIFGAHAHTKEAKLQVELAAVSYMASRLVRVRGEDGTMGGFGLGGQQEVVSARGRATGGRGFISGAGETELQLQKRRLQARADHLRAQLADVARTRDLHRAARQRHSAACAGKGPGMPVIAVVGYTNVGKSSLVSALSHSPLGVEDRLFATLDPRLRKVQLPSGRQALLSDTVGFISDLPVQLVEAFHSTLEEVRQADLLLHVIDSSAYDALEQRHVVIDVLQQLGVSKDHLQHSTLEAWNKVDLLPEDSNLKRAARGENVRWDKPANRSSEGEGDTEVDTVEEPLLSAETVYEAEGVDWKVSSELQQAFGAEDLPPRQEEEDLCHKVPRVAVSIKERTGLKQLLDMLDDAVCQRC